MAHLESIALRTKQERNERSCPTGLPSLLSDIVQSTTSPQPLQLILTHRMIRLDLQNLSARLGDFQCNLSRASGEEGFESNGRDAVMSGDERVGGFIREPEGEDPLFLRGCQPGPCTLIVMTAWKDEDEGMLWSSIGMGL